MQKKGFTLIELLVVIAIIGILAAMVLVALSTARKKAADTRIKGDVASLRTDAESFYSTGNTYAGWATAVQLVTGTAPNVVCSGTVTNSCTLAADIANKGGSNLSGAGLVASDVGSWAVRSVLTADTAYYVCADSRGATYGGTGAGAPTLVATGPVGAINQCSGGSPL